MKKIYVFPQLPAADHILMGLRGLVAGELTFQSYPFLQNMHLTARLSVEKCPWSTISEKSLWNSVAHMPTLYDMQLISQAGGMLHLCQT